MLVHQLHSQAEGAQEPDYQQAEYIYIQMEARSCKAHTLELIKRKAPPESFSSFFS